MHRLRLILCVGILVMPVLAVAQPKPSPDEFIPMSEVPPEEQIPAINLLGAAYGFVWIATIGYVWTIGRRMQKTEAEIADLERRRR